jgi:hypothetical protein
VTDLTILIVCAEEPKLVELSIQKNLDVFKKYPLVIVNRRGGEPFKVFNSLFFNQQTSFWFARRFGMEFVKTKYILCLDVDTVLPPQYIESAIQILETQPEVMVVASTYATPYTQDHLAFGTSIWRTDILKELYDWRLTEKPTQFCECIYMWKKIFAIGKKVYSFEQNATHLKEIPSLS